MMKINILGLTETSICVSQYDSIQNCLNRLGLSHCLVVHQGSILQPALSFSFFKIQENDTIYLVDQKINTNMKNYNININKNNNNNNNQNMRNIYNNDTQHKKRHHLKKLDNKMCSRMQQIFNEKYASKLKDPQNVFEQFKARLNPSSALEAARISDVFRQRIEANPAAFRKIYGKLTCMQFKKEDHFNRFPTVVPDRAAVPSTDLLPPMAMPIESSASN